jgi:hypothetical protein
MVGTTCIQDKEPAKIRAARAPIPGPGKIQTKAASPLRWHDVPSDIIVSFGIDPSRVEITVASAN